MKKQYAIRTLKYFAGLLLVALGVSLSIKSDLGVSPISSIPYSFTYIWGIEMGRATIMFYAVLVLAQLLLLRKKFKPHYLLQIAASFVFGYFITFCDTLIERIPVGDNMTIRIVLLILSCIILPLGLHIYIPANIVNLAPEGLMKVISDLTHLNFSTVKIIFDSLCVVVSLALCLAFTKTLGSVGAGTIVAALLVGINLSLISKISSKILIYKTNRKKRALLYIE